MKATLLMKTEDSSFSTCFWFDISPPTTPSKLLKTSGY